MRYSRRTVIAWTAAGFVAGATAGGSIAWFVDNGMRADWFGAIGTWVGSIGTIATIAWAVITFQHQQGQKRQEEIDAAVARREEELAKAKGITLTCSPYVRNAGAIQKVSLGFANSLAAPVKVIGVNVAHSTVPSIARNALMVMPGSVTHGLDVDPPVSAGPGETTATFSADDVVMTYDIDGVRWSRTGTGDRVRL